MNRNDHGFNMQIFIDPRYPLFIRLVLPYDGVPPLGLLLLGLLICRGHGSFLGSRTRTVSL